jgi:hypothetical protein
MFRPPLNVHCTTKCKLTSDCAALATNAYVPHVLPKFDPNTYAVENLPK